MIRLWPPAIHAATEEADSFHPAPIERIILDASASLEDWKATLETEEFRKALEGR